MTEYEALVGCPVLVVWRDATGLNGWKSRKELRESKPVKVRTVAMLVHVSDHSLHVASDKSGNAFASCGLIPLGWVESITELVER